MNASRGSSSLSESADLEWNCWRVGEFSAGMYGNSTLLESSSSSSKYLKRNEQWHSQHTVYSSILSFMVSESSQVSHTEMDNKSQYVHRKRCWDLFIYNYSCCKLKGVVGQIDVRKLIFLSGSPRLVNIGCFSDLPPVHQQIYAANRRISKETWSWLFPCAKDTQIYPVWLQCWTHQSVNKIELTEAQLKYVLWEGKARGGELSMGYCSISQSFKYI